MAEQANKYWQERNELLLQELLDEWGCVDHNIAKGAFFDTPFNWKCPGCSRGKREISRVDSNGKMMCWIVGHHDHFGDRVADALAKEGVFEYGHSPDRFTRFPTTLMCQDCNNADAAAKVRAQAFKHFSFAPFEISLFITEQPHQKHSLRPGVANNVYATARVQMRMICERIKEMFGADLLKRVLDTSEIDFASR